jgi:hypothetical protein
MAAQPVGEMAQPIGVRRRRGVLDELAALVDQANVEPCSTQIQPSVQHKGGPPSARTSMTR